MGRINLMFLTTRSVCVWGPHGTARSVGRRVTLCTFCGAPHAACGWLVLPHLHIRPSVLAAQTCLRPAPIANLTRGTPRPSLHMFLCLCCCFCEHQHPRGIAMCHHTGPEGGGVFQSGTPPPHLQTPQSSRTQQFEILGKEKCWRRRRHNFFFGLPRRKICLPYVSLPKKKFRIYGEFKNG